MSIITASREQFLRRYDKQKTRSLCHTAWYNWDLFLRHMLTTEADLLVHLRESENKKEIYYLLDHFVQFLRRKNWPSSVRTYFQFVKPWLKYCDIPIDSDMIREFVRFPKQKHDRPRGLGRDVVKKLLEESNTFYMAYILAQISSGMREGELLNMRWDWIDFSADPVRVLIPSEYTKSGRERMVFFSPEAVQAIKRLEKNSERVFPISVNTLQSYFATLRKKCGFTEKGSNGWYHVRIHKQRGFAEYNMSSTVGKEFAKTVLGHTDDLVQYFQNGATDDDFARDYKKALAALTIDEKYVLKKELDQPRKDARSVDSMERELVELKASMQRIEDEKNRLKR